MDQITNGLSEEQEEFFLYFTLCIVWNYRLNISKLEETDFPDTYMSKWNERREDEDILDLICYLEL